jgi:hypothetical protein
MVSKRLRILLWVIVLASILLSACGATATTAAPFTSIPPTAGPTATIDLCAPDHIKDAAQAVNRLIRAFDDTAQIASNTPREQLTAPISGLQSVRRQTEDLVVPDCLTNLKNLQLAHMNAVITTLVSFVGGADSAALNKYIALARTQRDAYDRELEKLLGVTLTPAPTMEPLPTQVPVTDTPIPPTATPEK